MAIKGQRTAAGEETRNEILDAAVMLLGRDGPDAFSAAALAREANVSKATIFHHFTSVDRILFAAFERHWRQSLELEADRPASASAYLKGLGEQLVDAAQSHPALLKAQAVFLMRAIFDRELSARLSEGAAGMHRLVVEALRSRLRPDASATYVESMALLAEMALDGLMINLVMRADERERFRRAWRLLIDLLLARGKPSR